MRRKQLGFIEWLAPAASAFGALTSYFGQEDANDANVMMANQNRLWQEQMSGTAHQREVEDLTKAGLNPILSATRGGASTPSGNVATVQSPGHAAVTSANESWRSMSEHQKRRQETKNLGHREGIEEFAGGIGRDASKGVDAIKAGVSGAVEAVLDKVAPLIGAVESFARSGANDARDFGGNVLRALTDNKEKDKPVNSAVDAQRWTVSFNQPDHIIRSKIAGIRNEADRRYVYQEYMRHLRGNTGGATQSWKSNRGSTGSW